MRITKQQAEKNRARVVAAAARLFREKGFEGVGVADLMRAAGLTHGGFYNHFGSKDELNAAACAYALTQAVERIESVAANDVEQGEGLSEYRRRYLSRKARDAEGFRCPMVAFGADVSRQGLELREVYARGLNRYLDAFVRAYAKERGGRRAEADLRAEAIVHFATMVGAVSLARSVAKADPVLSDEILDATLAKLEGPLSKAKTNIRASRAARKLLRTVR
ncbi:MAG TPA: TetR/AcrR family transcriptional regulator [Roseiarcus sp.]|nr:TetR/AcrR family transcriptional regulator [Roseiarcus sp.]